VHYPGIVSYSGMALGRSGLYRSPAVPFAPAQETTRIGSVQADDRRHVGNLLLDRSRERAAAPGGERAPLSEVPRPRAEARGRVVLSFLAQHIAQEVSPEIAGPDRYGSAAQAYIGARDFNAEMLHDGAGLDIRI